MTEIKWRASSSVSALYVAAALARGEQLTDSRLAEALAQPAAKLAAAVTAAEFSDEAFWRSAVPLAGATDNDQELAEQVFRLATGHDPAKADPAGEAVIGLAEAIQGAREAFDRARPDAVRELTLRTGPLRELWEARGPGLLAAIRRTTEQAILVDQADVYAVPPISSDGGGEAFAAQHTVTIEAVLANPHAALPEVARLGWLVARLGSEALGAGSGIAPPKLPRLVSLATVPAALAAAEFVELAAFDLSTISLALHAWQGVKPAEEDALAATLDRWWRTYSEERVPWPVAIAALDRKLAEST